MHLQVMTYKQLSEELSLINKVISGTRNFMASTRFHCPILNLEFIKAFEYKKLLNQEIEKRANEISFDLLIQNIYAA
jgi:hypothetical protein